MIATTAEYQKSQQELRDLETRVRSEPYWSEEPNRAGSKGFTKGGIRKMIARLHDELAGYQAAHPEPG